MLSLAPPIEYLFCMVIGDVVEADRNVQQVTSQGRSEAWRKQSVCLGQNIDQHYYITNMLPLYNLSMVCKSSPHTHGGNIFFIGFDQFSYFRRNHKRVKWKQFSLFRIRTPPPETKREDPEAFISFKPKHTPVIRWINLLSNKAWTKHWYPVRPCFLHTKQEGLCPPQTYDWIQL